VNRLLGGVVCYECEAEVPDMCPCESRLKTKPVRLHKRDLRRYRERELRNIVEERNTNDKKEQRSPQ
jgi:hypothetical protein